MSVVLAFGLSPLGQVPAYAKTGDQQPAQQEQVLQTQDTELQVQEDDNLLGDDFQVTASDVYYDARAWATGDFSTTSDATPPVTTINDRLIGGSVVKIQKYDTDVKKFKGIALANIDADYTYSESATALFDIEYQDALGNKLDGSAGHQVLAAGTYKVVLTGKTGTDYAGDKAVATFQVKPLDFTGAVVHVGAIEDGDFVGAVNYAGDEGAYPEAEQAAMQYAGKDINVGYAEYPTILVPDANVEQAAAVKAWRGDPNGHVDPTDDTSDTLFSQVAFVAKKLGAADVNFNPPTLRTRGAGQDVALEGKGNFTGTFGAKFNVGQGVFTGAGNITVCGVENAASAANLAAYVEPWTADEFNAYASDANLAKTVLTVDTLKSGIKAYIADNTLASLSGTLKTETQDWIAALLADEDVNGAAIDLTATDKNPTLADPDPAGAGKVVFGEDSLEKGSDFTVKYFDTAAKAAAYADDPTDSDAVKAAEASVPSKLGTYWAVLVAVSPDFVTNAESHILTVKYSVTGSDTLDGVAASADFGSANYLAKTTTIAEGTPSALVAPTAATFKSAAGADVTSTVGSDYELVKVEPWTAELEKEYLGADAYAKKYPYADAPYENTAKAAVTSQDVQSVAIDEDTYVYGFNGLPAGDYKLTVKGVKNFKGGEVYGKFTVAKATAAEGTAAGNVVITAGKAGYNDGDPVTLKVSDKSAPQLAMATGTAKDKKAKTTDALRQGTPLQVRTGEADYSVTYQQNGEDVTPAEAGTYDAVFTFGGDYFEAGTITKAAALTVGAAELNSVAKTAVILPNEDAQNEQYMYTGSAVEPELAFYAEPVDDNIETDEAKAIKAKFVDETDADAGVITQNDWNTNIAVGVDDMDDADDAIDTVEAAIQEDDQDFAFTAAQRADLTEYIRLASIDAAAGEDKLDFMTPLPKTVIDEDDYAVTYRADGSGDSRAALTGGKPYMPGNYMVIVSGAGKYVTTETNELTALKADTTNGGGYNFTVDKLKLDDAYTTVQFKDGDGWTDRYSTTMGDALEVEPQVRLVTTETKNDANPVEIPSGVYAVSYQGNTAVGTAAVKLSPTDANADTQLTTNDPKTKEFHIAAGSFSDVNAAIVLDKESAVYTGNKQNLDIKVKTNGGAGTALAVQTDPETGVGQYVWTVLDDEGKEVLDSEGSYTDGIVDAGEYTVIATGGGTNEYAGTLTAKFTVTPKEIKATDGNLAVTYFGGSTTAAAQYNDGNQLTAIQAGDVAYKVKATDAQPTTFTEVESADKASKVAGGTAYTVTGQKVKDAGSYTATIEFCGNFSGAVTKDFRVTPKEINGDTTYNVLAQDDMLLAVKDAAYNAKTMYNVDYDGKAHEPTATVYDADYNPVKGLNYTYLYDKNTDAGELTAKVTIIADGGNYTGRMDRYFTINSLAIGSDRLSVTWPDDQLAYTGSPIEPKPECTYTIETGEKVAMTYGKDFTVQEYSGDRTNVGDTGYAKIVGLAPNFVAGTATFVQAPFTVKAAPQEQTITASDISLAYGKTKAVGAKAETPLTYVPDNSGVYSVDAAGNVKALKAGTGKLTITAEGSDLYKEASKTITVKVTKAANTLTVKAVKATQKAKASKKTTIKAAKAFKVTKNVSKGKVTYKKTKGAKKISVASNGKVTVAKGLKAGKTYTVKVKATSKATANYKAASKVVTFKVKVTK